MSDKQPPDELLGQTIAGCYRIISRLGAGGMGVAYRAWDEEEGHPVVIKIPKRVFLEDPKFAERFAREIRLLQGLRHPHIVPIVDVGEHDGLPYVVMRFLPGGSLSNRRLRDEDGKVRPNPPGMLHLWLPAVAEALDFVHARSVVHRDVKPANIFFDAFWGALLGDFGIAKVIEESEAFDREATLTATSIGIGTPDYMAPEQFTPKAVLDGRTDQYALAVTVYEMLAGTRPFTGSTAHIVVEVTTQPPPRLDRLVRGLPGTLVEAVHRGLAKVPGERFGSCRGFAYHVLQDVPLLADEPDIARLLCPKCSNILKLPVAAAGQKGKCPKCQTQMKVADDLGALWLLDEARRQRRSQATVVDVEDIEVDEEPAETGTGIDEAALEAFKPVSSTTPIEREARRRSPKKPIEKRLATTLLIGGISLLGSLVINPYALSHPETGLIGRILGPGLAEAVGWSLTLPLLLVFVAAHAFAIMQVMAPAEGPGKTPWSRGLSSKWLRTVGGVAAVVVALAGLWFGFGGGSGGGGKKLPLTYEQQLAQAQEKVGRNPDDKTANNFLGRHWCLKNGDWKKGLPYLAKSGAIGLSSTAQKELDLEAAKPSAGPGDRVRLAKDWWTLAGQKAFVAAEEAAAIKKHAAGIYTAVVDSLTDEKDKEDANKWLDRDAEFRLLVGNKRPPEVKPTFPEEAIAFKGRTYFFPRNKTNQIEARLAAEKLGGALAVIDNAEENAFLAEHVHGPTWIGIGKSGASWVHLAGGGSATYLSWASGQPNNRPGEVAAAIHKTGDWHDHYGTDQLFYAVEWPSSTPPDSGATDKIAEEILARPPITNSIGMKLKLIPPGTFMMGSNDGKSDEKPVHEVRITKAFYIGVYEVTNAQWKAGMGGEPPSKWKEDDRPVEQVSWNDAIEFCEKLSERPEERAAGRVYRLPTEAEWEYACRAGTTTKWASGDDEETLGEFAWFRTNSSGQTHNVGRKRPNAWGLHDMHGNVWEWCSDWYGAYAAAAVADPTGPAGGSLRVGRGGGWLRTAWYCRSAIRYGLDPSSRYDALGFRLALSPSESTLPDAGQ